MQTNIWPSSNHFAAFDYAHLADQADSCRDSLQARLKERRTHGPGNPQNLQAWEWENRVLYSMYLEQRGLAREFRRRAERRMGND